MREFLRILRESAATFLVVAFIAAMSAGSGFISVTAYASTMIEKVEYVSPERSPDRPELCASLKGEEWNGCMGVGRR